MNVARTAALLIVAAVLGGTAWAARPAAASRPQPALAPVAGEVIVQFRDQAPTLRKFALASRAEAATVQAMLAGRAAALGTRIGREMQAGGAVGPRMQVVRASGVDAATLARELAADPEVQFAVPNGRKRFLAAPNDPLYPAAAPGVRPDGPDSGQWYLRAPDATIRSAIDIEAAWARTRGSTEVVVAVLDTGVRFDHPDLGRVATGGKLLPGYDFVGDAVVGNDGDGRDADPSDPGDWVTFSDTLTSTFQGCGTSSSSWHGTTTGSLVGAAADDAIGMAGSAPAVRVLPVRVLGKCFGSDADIQAGMLWAAGLAVDGVPANPHPARVINLSLGGSGSCDAAYQSVVDRITAAGVVIVAAAGNSAGGPVGTPANCAGVVSVLALRHAGTKVGFSDLGPEIVIAAPGGNCINTSAIEPCLYPIVAATNSGTRGPLAAAWTDSYNYTVGTSFSSPLVAGVVGLMFSQQPALSPAQVSTLLRSTARAFPTSGADNGPSDPTAVQECHAPTSGVTQLQCYCNTSQCGAGMLDAGAAVTAAAALAGPVARIDISTATPTAGSAVTLSAAASTAAGGSLLSNYAWALVDGGGIVTAFSSATNASTATLMPTAAGTFTVQLTVTDNLGLTNVVTRGVTVSAAPTTGGGGSGGGDSGGGAASLLWVLGVLTAAVTLRRRSPRRP